MNSMVQCDKVIFSSQNPWMLWIDPKPYYNLYWEKCYPLIRKSIPSAQQWPLAKTSSRPSSQTNLALSLKILSLL